MQSKQVSIWALWFNRRMYVTTAAALVMLVGCGDDDGLRAADSVSNVAPNEGLAGGPCFPNGTCFPNLECVDSMCQEPDIATDETSAWLVIDGLPVDWSTNTVVLTTINNAGVSQHEEATVRGLTVVELPIASTSTVLAFTANVEGDVSASGAGFYAMADDVEPGQTRRITGWRYRAAPGSEAVGGMPAEGTEEPNTRLSGRVMLNGMPASGALIVSSQYCGNTPCAGFSDEQGLFLFQSVAGPQRVEASLNSMVSPGIDIDAVGGETNTGDLVLMESSVLQPALQFEVVDGATGRVIPNAEVRDVSGQPVGEVDEYDIWTWPATARWQAFYLRAPGYARSSVLLPRKLRPSGTDENAVLQIELYAYSNSCKRLAGNWPSTAWQSFELWSGVNGNDPETGWIAVPESEQMRVFIDPDNFGWADVDLGAPFVDGADGYWLLCAPLGASLDRVYLGFAPLNYLQHGFELPSRFPAVGEIPGVSLLIQSGHWVINHLHRAQLAGDDYWYGYGHAYLGRWLYGISSQERPPECEGVPDVHTGDYIIGGNGVEEELAGLLCLRRIEGNLQFGPTAFESSTIEIPWLESVGGELRVFNSLNVIEYKFPSLTAVGGNILVEQTQIERIEWPLLREAGAVTMQSNPELRAIEFPSLLTVEGGLLLRGSGIESVHLPVLSTVGGLGLESTSISTVTLPALAKAGMETNEYSGISLNFNASLATIKFPVLEEVRGTLQIDVVAADATVEFPRLRTIGKNLHVSRASFRQAPLFDSLERIEGDLSFVAQARNEMFIPELNFPLLVEVGEGLGINAVENLRELNFPMLRDVGDTLWIQNLRELTTLEFQELQTVGQRVDPSVSKGIDVHNNDALLSIYFPSLSSSGDFNVYDNPVLQALDAGSLFQCAALVIISDNQQLCVSLAARIYTQCGKELPEFHGNKDGC
jgi:hypothetical protein